MKKRNIIIFSALFVLLIIVFMVLFLKNDKVYVTYRDFYQYIESGEITEVNIFSDTLEFIKDDNKYYTDNPQSAELKEKLLLEGIKVDVDTSYETFSIIFDILFYVFFFGIVIFAISKLMDLYVKTFKLVKHTNITFDAVAGMEELKKEMTTIVEMLKNPEKSKENGIRPIKGIILEGPPGNGKTLFARALAEESDVNYIASKGADFQSAMMSMGSKKIKMLFEKAKRHKPCIIFIDEFDSIGERRNYAGTGVDKENNRIITSMLNEMDGFEPGNGILVIAATNSFASLDPALIRPGRFDLKYNISNPDKDTREKLIELYLKNKNMSKDLSKESLVDAFEGLSCSAIETIINEALIISKLNNRNEIIFDDIVSASKKTCCSLNLRKMKK